MICLSDNDILLHLAAWNLLPEFQAFLQDVLRAPLSEVYVMNAFTACLRSADARPGKQYKRWLDQYGQAALERALRFCESVKQVYDLPHDRSVVAAFQDIDDIDEGEAILIAVAHRHSESIILTNEWRFLAALNGQLDCVAYYQALQGRVVHLRQVIAYFLEQKSHAFLAAHIRPQTRSDRCIHGAFQKSAAETRATLQQAVAEVQRIGGGLLWVPPPVFPM